MDAAPPGATSCSRGRPTAAGARSPTRSRSTTAATSSGPSSATRSRPPDVLLDPVRRGRSDPQAAPARVVRRPRPQRRDALGGDARPGLPARHRAASSSATTRARRRSTPATWRLRVHGPGVERPLELSYADLEPLPSRSLTRGDRVRRQRRPRPVRLPAGHAGGGHAVEARRHRRRELARRPARRGARPRRRAARRRRRHGARARRPVHQGRRRPRLGAPSAPGRQGARRRADRARDERQRAPARPRLPGAPGGAGLGRDREHQVARRRSRCPTRRCGRRGTRRGTRASPSSPSRARSSWPGTRTLPAGRCTTLHGRSWSGHAPIRAVQVSTDGGATWRPPACAARTCRTSGSAGSCRSRRPRAPRAARARHRRDRAHAARHGAVQRRRLSVLGRRAPPGDGRVGRSDRPAIATRPAIVSTTAPTSRIAVRCGDVVGQRRERDRADHRGADRRVGEAEGAPEQARVGACVASSSRR